MAAVVRARGSLLPTSVAGCLLRNVDRDAERLSALRARCAGTVQTGCPHWLVDGSYGAKKNATPQGNGLGSDGGGRVESRAARQ